MVSRTVISSSGRRDGSVERVFNFRQDEIPALSSDWKGPSYVVDYKHRAWELYNQISLPSVKDESWRRTDLRGLDTGNIRIIQDSRSSTINLPDELLKPLASDNHGGQIQLQPGGSNRSLSSKLSSQGVIFTDINTAELEYASLVSNIFGKIVNPDEGKFAAMAAAFSNQGVFLYIPPGVQVDEPLHSVLWAPGINSAHFSHIIIWLDEGASATYVHESSSPTEALAQSLHAGIVEIRVGPAANLRFVELQSWGKHVWNFTHERARVEKDGKIDWIFGAVGSHLTKNFSDLDLVGEGASGKMSGFYFTDGNQHLDHDTQQNHLAPNTNSDLLYKGALQDRSRSVWQGMIYVAPNAQKTDGYQANRNLVLSSNARADSIPGLEILADDVRCTHGATVGQIDPEQIFYLKCRGISDFRAKQLIVEGFFDPIMQRIPFDGVRLRFQQAILEKMG